MGRTTRKSTETGVERATKKSDLELVVRLEPGWGMAFRRIRDGAGANQTELAELIDCDPSTVSGWESERFKPSPEMLRRALDNLGCDPRELFRLFGITPEVKEILDAQLSPKDAAIAVADILLRAGSNDEAISGIIAYMNPKVLGALSTRALYDTPSAKLWFECVNQWNADQLPNRRAAMATDVTPPTPFIAQARRDNSELAQAVDAEIIEE